MKEELATEKKEGSMLVPFLVGGLIGAIVALLYAPKAGKELRKDIMDLASDTREMFGTTLAKGKKLYEGSGMAIKNAVDAGKSAFIEERNKHRQAA